MHQRIILGWAALAVTAACVKADLVLVADGKPTAVVITAQNPGPVAQYAAEEILFHVEKATGVKLPQTTENAIPSEYAVKIYIGNCQAARSADMDPSRMAPEAFRIKTTERELFIIGEDGDGDPLSTETHAGTLWGVYELLEQVLKARWLWPGDLGTYVPRTQTVSVPSLDQSTTPWLFQRNIRPGINMRPGADEAAAFSPQAQKDYARNQQVFLRRHRMGRSMRIRYGHAFENWWERYGKEHPDWFQLLEDGRRGPERPGDRFSMCVSNPEFHRKIVELWKEERAQKAGEFLNINCCENDIPGRCACERCRAWDGPQPEAILPRFGPRIVSDRYARYYLAVQQLAAKEDPGATAVGYAYVNYYPAPSIAVRLNDHVLVGVVPDLFFPRSAQDQEWIKQQWAGWAGTGARLFLRPNYFLDGYCMPHIFVHQFADEFQFEAKHGMAGTDYDSLTGQWATQGPNLYLLVRLHTRPERPADDLLSEYYEAFGPAAKLVKAYFDYWEKYVTDRREQFEQIAKERRAGWSSYAKMADALFPPDSFQPAEEILKNASQAVEDNAECAQRVDFLKKGLQHARLCAQLSALLYEKGEDLSPVAWARARNELLAFRRSIEGDCVANMSFLAAVEARSWKIPETYNGENLVPVSDTPRPLEGAPTIPVRGTHTFVAVLKAEERLTAQVTCKQVDKYADPVHWRVFGPTDNWIAKGELPPGENAKIEVPAVGEGIYVLLVRSGGNVAQVTLQNDHAALAEREIHLLGETFPLFFSVPKGVRKFAITLQSPAPGETARLRISDPDGKEAAVVSTGQEKTCVAEVTVPEGRDGKAWSACIERTDTGVLEDYTLILDKALPAYWSHAADRLVVPKKPD